MFVRPDFQTKKELKNAVGRGEVVTVWSDVYVPCPADGELIAVHGPRAVNRVSGSDPVWSARVLWKRGKIVLVK